MTPGGQRSDKRRRERAEGGLFYQAGFGKRLLASSTHCCSLTQPGCAWPLFSLRPSQAHSCHGWCGRHAAPGGSTLNSCSASPFHTLHRLFSAVLRHGGPELHSCVVAGGMSLPGGVDGPEVQVNLGAKRQPSALRVPQGGGGGGGARRRGLLARLCVVAPPHMQQDGRCRPVEHLETCAHLRSRANPNSPATVL